MFCFVFFYIDFDGKREKAKKETLFFIVLHFFFPVDESFPQNLGFMNKIECQEFEQAHRLFNCKNN